MVDLRPIIRTVVGSRLWILAGLVVGMGLGLAAWRFVGRQFEAVVTLTVNQPRSNVAGLTPVTTATFRAMLENYTVTAEALKRSKLDSGLTAISPRDFIRDSLSVEEVRGTSLIRVHVRLNDATLAAKLANDLSELAVDLSRRVNQDEGTTLRDQLKGQATEAEQRLHEAERTLLEFRRANQVELLKTDVESALKQREKLLQVEADLSGEKAGLAAAEREQGSRKPIVTLNRTIDSDATLMEAARSQGLDFKGLMGLGLRNEVPSSVFERMDAEVALARTRVAQLEQQRQQILQSSAQIRDGGRLLALYDKEIQLSRLEADQALARKVYEDVAQRYEQARALVTSGSAQLQVVDKAVPTEDSVSWSAPVWIGLGALLGAASVLGLILLRAIGRLVSTFLSEQATA